MYIQGVSEILVLILTSRRTRQFMKLFPMTFSKIRILDTPCICFSEA
jgi:hypothetical protein